MIYTVHEPPLSKAETKRGPENFVFVRDGFYWWAFLLTPFWLLYRRLWLAFVVYAAVFSALAFGLRWLRVGDTAMWLALLLLSALVALEASTLLRRKLRWWGWREAGLVEGGKRDFAEQRFFDQWTRELPPAAAPAAAPAFAVGTTARWARPQDNSVVGLFPEPGSPR